MAEKKSFLNKFILDAAMLLFSLFKTIPNLIMLIEIEARNTGKSLISLLILYLVAATLLTSLWLCALSFCVVYLVSLQYTWLHAISLVTLTNLVVLLIVLWIASKIKNKMSFEKTRHLLRNFKR